MFDDRELIYYIGDEKVTREEYFYDADIKNGLEDIYNMVIFFLIGLSFVILSVVFSLNGIGIDLYTVLSTNEIIKALGFGLMSAPLINTVLDKGVYYIFKFYYGEKPSFTIISARFKDSNFNRKILAIIFFFVGFIIQPFRIARAITSYDKALQKYNRPIDFKQKPLAPLILLATVSICLIIIGFGLNGIIIGIKTTNHFSNNELIYMFDTMENNLVIDTYEYEIRDTSLNVYAKVYHSFENENEYYKFVLTNIYENKNPNIDYGTFTYTNADINEKDVCFKSQEFMKSIMIKNLIPFETLKNDLKNVFGKNRNPIVIYQRYEKKNLNHILLERDTFRVLSFKFYSVSLQLEYNNSEE